MSRISADMQEEIQRRVEEGRYGSADDLLRLALKALDDSAEAAAEWLERELLKGLEGEDVEVSRAEFARLRQPYERQIAEHDVD